MNFNVARVRRCLGYGAVTLSLFGNASRSLATELSALQTQPSATITSRQDVLTSANAVVQADPATTVGSNEDLQHNPKVRVCVAEASEQLTIVTSGRTIVLNESGTGIAALQDNAAYTVSRTVDGLDISSSALPHAVWIESTDGFIQINDHQYRGKVLILNNGSRILAVNVVPIEDYLKSVVGSEMYPDWHMEALKAQAVAARSYAVSLMEKPASAWFDLYSDERDQAYKGIETETAETIAAVTQTAGEVLVRNGTNGAAKPSQVLMAQYASTEEISRIAHNGVGMSQTGAERLATAGHSYLEILGAYYQGASLARLQLDS